MPRSVVGFAAISVVGLAAILVLALWIGGVILSEGAGAQSYPAPTGSLSVEAAATTPGGTTNVTATVLDNDGNPVEGATVTFTITSQPGSDAQWSNGKLEITATTNANGVATALLTAGSSTGNIIIETLSGTKSSQVTVAVGPEEVPGSGGTPPLEGSESGIATWQIALLAVIAATVVGGFAITVRRKRA